jgi:RNA polymerase sigma factor (sigma-70 family)
MAVKPLGKVLSYVYRAIGPSEAARWTDGEALEAFVCRQDQAAFNELLRRHGALVWGVCSRLLAEPHDAEDAFQATFLVLIRKAHTFQGRSSLTTWLYGIAHRVALKARARAARRRKQERRFAQMRPGDVPVQAGWEELRPVLDAELSRLPEKYRYPLVLCYLQGKTHDEAARELGHPTGSMSKLIGRGRELLRERLAQRGVVVSGAALGAILLDKAAGTAAPAAVLEMTAMVARLVAGVPGTTVGVASAQVSNLTEGVVRTMFLAKLKGIILAAAACLAVGAGSSLLLAERQERTTPEISPAATVVAGEQAPRPARDDLTPGNFAKLQALIRPQENEWRHLRVHWLTDVVAARKKAAAEDKPIIVLRTGGAGYNDPLGSC